MRKGTAVRFTVGPLGALESPYAHRFGAGIVQKGECGNYLEPHNDDSLAEWHIIEVEMDDGRVVFVPVHESQFEAIA